MNWSISEVKRRGNATFKTAYWKCVLVAFIISVLSGGVSTVPNFSGSYNVGSFRDENGNFDFSAIYETPDDSVDIGGLAEEIVNSPNFGIIAVTFTIVLIFVMIISLALDIFLVEPLRIGCLKFFKDAGRTRQYELGTIGFSFGKNYMNIVKIMFFYSLKIFLWTLLLIIPGIVKSYEYRMVPYILSDDPTISSEEAFRRSREMMTGNKWHAFLLDLSFIGWMFLSILTCGILLIFYVDPYIAATDAELYLTLRGESFNPGSQYGNPYANNQYNNFGGQYGGGYRGGYGNVHYGNGQYGGYPTYGKSQYYDNTGKPYDGNTYGTAPKGSSPVSGSSYGQSPYEDHVDPSPAPSDTGSYTDGEYRAINADGDTSDSTNNNDSPFNTPY